MPGATETDFFDDLEKGVLSLLSASGRMHLDRTAGIVQITDFADRLDQVGVYVEAVQLRATRQVRIDAQVFEVALAETWARSIDWRAPAIRSATTVRPPSGPGSTSVAVTDVDALIRAIAQQGAITPIASPQVLAMNNEQLRQFRWSKMSFVFQSAMNALNPILSIGEQIADAIQAHVPMKQAQALEKAASLLKLVGIDSSRLSSYPHQLSGGMRQRVVIAIALALDPPLMIMDEPTTALDVVMQAQVLQLLERLREQLGLALILISHDLGVLAETCDRIAVMYAGRIVETGSVRDVFDSPQHPYTKRLLDTLPVIGGARGLATPIPGGPPDPGDLPQGCRFRPRCPYAAESGAGRVVAPPMAPKKISH